MIEAVIGALVMGVVGVMAIVVVQGVTSQLTGTPTPTPMSLGPTAAPIPPGTPLSPVNVIPWVIAEAVMIAGLISSWYFYHHLPKQRARRASANDT